jgi:hypothetical protein
MSIQKPTFSAVLTGDIVNSTKLPTSQESWLLEVLDRFLEPHPHEFYRGDSFQAYIREPSEALEVALACRAVTIEITTKEEASVRGDIRIGIGIGEVAVPVSSLGSAKGEAFFLSGRELDELQQTERRLAITCSDKMANIGFEIMADYLDSIFLDLSGKQADVIVSLLRGLTQQQLAISSKKAKSTISGLATAGRWPEIERILQQYSQLIELIS